MNISSKSKPKGTELNQVKMNALMNLINLNRNITVKQLEQKMDISSVEQDQLLFVLEKKNYLVQSENICSLTKRGTQFLVEQTSSEKYGPAHCDNTIICSINKNNISNNLKRPWREEIFSNIDKEHWYAIAHLRLEVFVLEHNCSYNDFDYYDQSSIHIYLEEDNKILAYVRVLPPEQKYKEASFGRLVVRKDKRGENLGKILAHKAMECIQRLYPKSSIKISAQCYLQKFYENLGFKSISAPYLEANIMHVLMLKENKLIKF